MGVTYFQGTGGLKNKIINEEILKINNLADAQCRAQYPILERCEELFHQEVSMKDCKKAFAYYKECIDETTKAYKAQQLNR